MSALVLVLWIFLCVPVPALLQTLEQNPSPSPFVSFGENPEILLVQLKTQDKSSSDSIPPVKTIVAWMYVLVAIPLATLLIAILVILIMCILRRKSATSGQYGSSDDLEKGFIKEDEKRMLTQQLAQFLISSDDDSDMEDQLPKKEPVISPREVSQQQLIKDSELGKKVPSTMKPMDTTVQDSVASQRSWTYCICGQRCSTCQRASPSDKAEPISAIFITSHPEERRIVFTGCSEACLYHHLYHQLSRDGDY